MTALTGEQILDDLSAWVAHYMAFPDRHCAPTFALWCAHTWASTSFYVTPRLIAESAEPGSGKTRLLELGALLCCNAKITLSTTTAALYRRIAKAVDDEKMPPTVLQDETDAIFMGKATPQTEDLRALFNAGYKRGATVDRCEGDAKNMAVREFPVFAPVALAGIAGRLPDTITSRGITIKLRRRAPGETVAPYRERDAEAEAAPMREELSAWVSAHAGELADARPQMPAGVVDRPSEVWEALLAIADLAGGHWPKTARAACRHFVLDSEPDELSLGIRLLTDIRELFGTQDRMASEGLVFKLVQMPEAPWAEVNRGRQLDQRRLAKELKRYGVRAQDIRIDTRVVRGYRVDGGLADAWNRYLPDLRATSATSATPQVEPVIPVAPENPVALASATPASSATPEIPLTSDVAHVADVAPKSGAPRLHAVPDGHPKTCREWFDRHIRGLIAEGHTTADSAVVYPLGEAAGWGIQNLRKVASKSPLIAIAEKRTDGVTWAIGEGVQSTYVPCPEWLVGYLRECGGWVPASEVYAAGGERYGRSAIKSAAQAAHILKRGASIATEWSLDPSYQEKSA